MQTRGARRGYGKFSRSFQALILVTVNKPAASYCPSMNSRNRIAGSLLCVLALIECAPVQADARKATAAINAQIELDRSARQSQKKIDGLADEQARLLDEYRSATKEVDRLRADNERMRRRVEHQRTRLVELESQLDQAEGAQPLLPPLADRMVTSLAQFVELDRPFLETERQERIANLRALLEASDSSMAERFRRIFDALRVEVEYGQSLEAYRGELVLDRRPKAVDFLRIGRVGLFFATPDGREANVWNPDLRKWTALDADGRRQVAAAMRVARKESSPSLLVLPLAGPGAPK